MQTNQLPEMTPETAKALARNRVARHRAGKHRIDYVPAPDVLAWIERVKAYNPGASYHKVIDRLLREAQKALKASTSAS